MVGKKVTPEKILGSSKDRLDSFAVTSYTITGNVLCASVVARLEKCRFCEHSEVYVPVCGDFINERRERE